MLNVAIVGAGCWVRRTVGMVFLHRRARCTGASSGTRRNLIEIAQRKIALGRRSRLTGVEATQVD